MPGLFDPITIGSIEAKNRIMVAPITRARATDKGVPTEIMIEYYKQRASAGLIFSEAVGISRVGLGWAYAPGIYTEEQIEHWRPIIKAIHDNGGKIVCQLWHMGRATHSNIIGQQPVSASATTYPKMVHTYAGKLDPEEARPMTKDEIKQTIQDYVTAARNALDVGFDGVQVHAANGYLIDQFLRDSTNQRTDEYGGSIENRLRLLDEIVTAVIKVAGADRTSVRLSPNGDIQGVKDSHYRDLFLAAADLLQKHNISMLTLRESKPDSSFMPAPDQPQIHEEIRKRFKNVLVLNQEYTRDSADETIRSGLADGISFGRDFISNPDLVEKFEKNLPLREFNSIANCSYTHGREGYLDF